LYGDKSNWCKTHIPDASLKRNCYYGNNANLCCDTCPKYRNESAPCKFTIKHVTYLLTTVLRLIKTVPYFHEIRNFYLILGKTIKIFQSYEEKSKIVVDITIKGVILRAAQYQNLKSF